LKIKKGSIYIRFNVIMHTNHLMIIYRDLLSVESGHILIQCI